MRPIDHIAFVGFGEAGGILGAALVAKGIRVSMYDRLLDDPDTAPAMKQKAELAGVRSAMTLADAIAGAPLIVSAVTATSDAEVAQAVAACIEAGQTFIDINSVSPKTKQQGQGLVEAAGGHYVESAVMAPIPPYGLSVPMLLGGTRAEEVAHQLGALTVECLSAARAYGAEEIVLGSLNETFNKMRDTQDLPGYLISRVAEHGRRRAAEMREVCETLSEAGVQPSMSDACARLQDRFADAMVARGIQYDALSPFVWQDLLDQITR